MGIRGPKQAYTVFLETSLWRGGGGGGTSKSLPKSNVKKRLFSQEVRSYQDLSTLEVRPGNFWESLRGFGLSFQGILQGGCSLMSRHESQPGACTTWVSAFSVLEMEPRAWGMQGKGSATELHPSKKPVGEAVNPGWGM